MLNGFFKSQYFSLLSWQALSYQYNAYQIRVKLQILLIIAKTGKSPYLCLLILKHGNNPGIIAENDRFTG